MGFRINPVEVLFNNSAVLHVIRVGLKCAALGLSVISVHYHSFGPVITGIFIKLEVML